MALDSTPKIFVGGLPSSCDETVLSEYFGSCGNVMHVEVKRDMATGGPRGFGFVTFDSPEAVNTAVSMNGQHSIDGKNIEVKPAMEKSKGDAGGCKGGGKAISVPALGSMSLYGPGKGVQQPKGWAPGGGYDEKGWGGGGAYGRPQEPQYYGGGRLAVGPSYPAKGTGPYPAASHVPQYGAPQYAAPQYGCAWPAKGAKAPAWEPIGKGRSPYAAVQASPYHDMADAKGKGPAPEKTFERDDAKIFVGGLPKSTNEQTLRDYFGGFGPVARVEMKIDPLTNASRGFCFVTFEEAEAAMAAIAEYETHQIDGKWVEVKQAMENGRPAPGQKGGTTKDAPNGGCYGGGYAPKGAYQVYEPPQWVPY